MNKVKQTDDPVTLVQQESQVAHQKFDEFLRAEPDQLEQFTGPLDDSSWEQDRVNLQERRYLEHQIMSVFHNVGGINNAN